jgi:hypothetical protein
LTVVNPPANPIAAKSKFESGCHSIVPVRNASEATNKESVKIVTLDVYRPKPRVFVAKIPKRLPPKITTTDPRVQIESWFMLRLPENSGVLSVIINNVRAISAAPR